MWATPSCSHFLDMCWLVIVTDEFQRGWWCYLLPYPIAILPCCRCSGFNWAQNPAVAPPQWCRKRPSCCMDKSTQLCDWEEGQNFSKWPHHHWWHPGMLSQPQRKSIIHKEYPIALMFNFRILNEYFSQPIVFTWWRCMDVLGQGHTTLLGWWQVPGCSCLPLPSWKAWCPFQCREIWRPWQSNLRDFPSAISAQAHPMYFKPLSVLPTTDHWVVSRCTPPAKLCGRDVGSWSPGA